MSTKLVIGDEFLTIISAYAPQVGLDASIKQEFWEDLEEVVERIPMGEKLIIGGDLNGHVGVSRDGFESVHGGFGFGDWNEAGNGILDFALAYDLGIMNTWFEKRDSHLVTYRNGGTASQIDFFLVRNVWRKSLTNCKVIPGESAATQHRVVVLDLRGKRHLRKRRPQVDPRIKWWKLQGESRHTFVAKIADNGESKGNGPSKKKTRDIGKVKCVKDTDQKVLVQDKEIKERCRSYFDTLFNGHQEQNIGNLNIPSNMINREFKRRIQKYDIVLIDETKVGVQQKLELWRDTLEARGFRLSRSKTEYMECRFSDNSDREAGMITFDGKVVHGSTSFRYLGSIIQKDGKLDGDVAHRIKAGWLKWKSATGVLCDPDMPRRLKGKFYRTTIRPALLYGTECWALKQCHVQKMNVAEMRMLRWMCGHTKKDRLRNEVIREKVRVASIEDKMMENRLRWFGHVRRRPVDAPVRRLGTLHRNTTFWTSWDWEISSRKGYCNRIKANFINVSVASISFKWLEKTSNALFSYAKKLAPVVIYLDDLLGACGKNETSILKGFVAAWDGLELKESQRVLVIGGTNRPFDIDEAVICCMPRRIYVGLPDVDISLKMPQYGGGPVRDKYYSQAQYDEVLDDWSQFVYSHLI
ncbi:hypothetical protein OROMI_004718 [Orobanche minor]